MWNSNKLIVRLECTSDKEINREVFIFNEITSFFKMRKTNQNFIEIKIQEILAGFGANFVLKINGF